MEPSAKRPRVGQAAYDSDEEEVNQDELSMTATQFAFRQDPMYRLDKARNKAAARLKSTFESIFEKYEKDFTDVGDEINLHTGEVTVNNGHLQSIDKNEQGERGDSPESDEEERILAGKRPPSAAGRTRPPHSPHSSPTPLSFRASLFGNNPIDPAWQTPELPMNNPYNGFGFGGQSMGAFPFSNFGQSPLFGWNGQQPGSLGSPFGSPGLKRTTSARSLNWNRSSSAGRTAGDAEDDDILLSRHREDADIPRAVRRVEKSTTFGSFAQRPKGKSLEPPRGLPLTEDSEQLSKQSRGRRRSKTHKGIEREEERQIQPDHADPSQEVPVASIKPATEESQIARPKRGRRKRSDADATSRAVEGKSGGTVLRNSSQSRRSRSRRRKDEVDDAQQTSNVMLDSGLPANNGGQHHTHQGPSVADEDSRETRRKSGRPKKVNTIPAFENPLDVAGTENSVYPPVSEISGQAAIPVLQEGEKDVRRKRGRPRKSLDAGAREALQEMNHTGHDRPSRDEAKEGQETLTRPLSAIRVVLRASSSVGALQDHRSQTNELPGHMPDGEQRSDSHGRRSARSRKKTEFYGNISWLKRGAKPIKTDVGDPTSASNSNSVATTVSDSHRDPDRDLESTMVKGAKEVPLQASGTVQLDSSLGITDQASFKDHTIPKPNGTNTAEMEISQSLPAELVQQPYVSAKAMEVKKDQASVVEKFSRNVLDPSYEFSDEEGDVLPMPIPFEDFMRSSPVQEKELHVSDMTTGLSSAVPDEDGQTASGVLESPRSQEADDAISYQPKADDETRQHGIDQSENNLTTSDVVSQEDPEQIAARLVDKLLQGAIEVENEPLNQEIQDPVDDSIIPSDQPDLPPQSDLAPTQEESVQLQAEVTAAEEEPEIFLRPVSCINRNTPGRTEESPAPSIPTPRTPLTPQKKTTGSSKKPTSTRRPSASSSKKFALATLLPDDETDELSFFSPAAAAAPTPPPFRSPRAQSRALSLAASASATTAATPLASASHHRRRSLLAGTPSSSARRRPQTDLRRLPKRKSAGAGAVVNSSPLARTAARNLLATPKKRKRFADEMEAELVRTPGGTMRKCGVDGFVCDRDFCFTCCR